MRVGVYVPNIPPEAGGVLTFVRDVLTALASAPQRHQFHVLYTGAAPPEGSSGLPVSCVPDPASPDCTLDATADSLRLDLLWFVTPQLHTVTIPFITTVWDLEHRNQPYFPEVSISGWTWEQREQYYRSMLPRSACVVVGTKEGKRQIEQYYGVPSSLITVASFATPSFLPAELDDRDPPALADLGIRAPFVFYPAQFWPHKNHVVLLHAIKRLKNDKHAIDLVLTGADKGNLTYLQDLIHELDLDGQVRLLGFVDRRTLVELYRQALALVFPSFFGPDNLPPLEAFVLGCPVIASAIPGAAEIYEDGAILIDPTDERAWADAIASLMMSPDRREKLIARGTERSKQSTAADYVNEISARLDALEPIRRSWSRSDRYVHTGAAPAAGDRTLTGILDAIAAVRRELSATREELSDRSTSAIHSVKTQLEASQSELHVVKQHLDAARTELAAQSQVIQTLGHEHRQDAAEMQQSVASLQRQLIANEIDRQTWLDQLRSLDQQLLQRDAAATQADLERRSAVARAAELEGSLSWRWTRPLRWVSGPLLAMARGLAKRPGASTDA